MTLKQQFSPLCKSSNTNPIEMLTKLFWYKMMIALSISCESVKKSSENPVNKVIFQ